MDSKVLFQEKYDALLESHNADNLEIIQQRFGAMGTEDEVNEIAYELEGLLLDRGVKKGVVKRVFSLIIEALQNIRLHGEVDVDGNQLAYYLFAYNPVVEEFVLSTADIIFDKNIIRVQPKIDKINSLDRAGLKEFYMETLTDGERSVKGGAGLGFITVAMKAKSKIDYQLISIGDDRTFFQMQTNILTKKE